MNLFALVLAAGSARRFGSDKLSASFAGEPLVHHAIHAALKAPVKRVIVVAHPALDVSMFPNIDVVRISSHALSETLRAGVRAAHDTTDDIDGLFVFLGDMPLVPHDIASRLADFIGTAYAAMPRHTGRPGHPVLLSNAAFVDVAKLEGDTGLGKLLRSRDDVVFYDCQNPHIHADIDSPENLALLEREVTSFSHP